MELPNDLICSIITKIAWKYWKFFKGAAKWVILLENDLDCSKIPKISRGRFKLTYIALKWLWLPESIKIPMGRFKMT